MSTVEVQEGQRQADRVDRFSVGPGSVGQT
jgi:hypothetical protein